MNIKLISIFLIVLIIGVPFSSGQFGFSVGGEKGLTSKDGIDVFSIDIKKQTPPTIPAIALEQKSEAIVRFFVEINKLDFMNDINIIGVSMRGSGISFTPLTKPINGGYGDRLEGIIEVRLRGGYGKTPYRRDETHYSKDDITSEDVENFCASYSDDKEEFDDVVPDEIGVEGRLDIRFTAKSGENYLSKYYYEGMPDVEFAYEGREEEEFELRISEECSRRYTDTISIDKCLEGKREEHEKSKGEKAKIIITDVVYLNEKIAIDKTKLYDPSPEEMRKQVCRTEKLINKIESVLGKLKKIETIASVICIVTGLVAVAGVYFGFMDVCDAMDSISLACDWVLCPSSKCGGINPIEGGLLASLVMCWGKNPPPCRRFFGGDCEADYGNKVTKELIDEQKISEKAMDELIKNNKDSYESLRKDYGEDYAKNTLRENHLKEYMRYEYSFYSANDDVNGKFNSNEIANSYRSYQQEKFVEGSIDLSYRYRDFIRGKDDRGNAVNELPANTPDDVKDFVEKKQAEYKLPDTKKEERLDEWRQEITGMLYKNKVSMLDGVVAFAGDGSEEEKTVFQSEEEHTKKGTPIPHYACITGVNQNLEMIVMVLRKYQECLMAAYSSGGQVSVGVCDRMKNLYLCDRILGALLEASSQTPGGFVGKMFSWGASKVGLGGRDTGKVKREYEDVKELGRRAAETYGDTPWGRLLSEKDAYLRHKVCESFIGGKFWDLERFKTGLFLPSYPDSYYVLTEKRMWDCEAGNVEATFGNECMPISYSYDVFYQIFAGTGYTGERAYYSVLLRGNRKQIDRDSEGNFFGYITLTPCSILIKNGYVDEGKMVQENLFRVVGVEECDVDEQCIRFRGLENCETVGLRNPLSSGGSLDPFNIFTTGVVDNDNDGMSDNWERLYDLDADDGRDWREDRDGDGYCNVVEFMENTNPNNADIHPDNKELTSNKKCDEKYYEAIGMVAKYKRKEEQKKRENSIEPVNVKPVEMSSLDNVASLIEEENDVEGDEEVSTGGEETIIVLASYNKNEMSIIKDRLESINGIKSVLSEINRKYSIPESFILGVITQESKGDYKAISSSGAVGLMQLMPAVSQEYGLSVIEECNNVRLELCNYEEDERFDVGKNLNAGAGYLKELINTYQSHTVEDDKDILKISLAAYRLGKTNINNCIRQKKGVNPCLDSLPSSTKTYIRNVLTYSEYWESNSLGEKVLARV